jgi:UDP-2,3-diacylglucosamine pyrophosphatase LpxH
MPQKWVDIGRCANVLVVSDVHMRFPDDERTHDFLQCLTRVGQDFKCETLILLGDVFDFINARQSFYFSLWRTVFEKLRSLKQQGVRIIFVEGNHDYGFEHGPVHELGECFDLCGDFIVTAHHERLGRTVFLHSDDVVCPPSYRLFRGVVKSRLFQSLLHPVPGRLTSAIFSRYATLSRSKDYERPLRQDFFKSCVEHWLEEIKTDHHLQPDLCVLGHIHVHLDDQWQNIRFVSGPAWFTAPSLLLITEHGTVERFWLKEGGCPVEPFRLSADRL